MVYLFGFFDRPVGAAADVKELEYISALHQSSPQLNTDGPITAQDVRRFLRSRFGLILSEDDAIDIVRGLSGRSRLPLPEIEQPRSFFRPRSHVDGDDETHVRANISAVPEDEDEDHELNGDENPSSISRKKKNVLRRRHTSGDSSVASTTGWLRNPLNRRSTTADEDQVEDADHHWNMLKKSKNLRRDWHFKRDAPKRDKTRKSMEMLVKYDLMELLSFLFIPTLVRIEHFRFTETVTPPMEPEPRIVFDGDLRTDVWKLPRLGWYLFTYPRERFKERNRKRLIAMKAALQPKPVTLLDDVLRIMLSNLQEEESLDDRAVNLYEEGNFRTQSSSFPKVSQIPVSVTLVRKLLTMYGEKEAAQDETLVGQMVELVGGEGALLNERSFAHALTVDVQAWPIECEDDISTSFFDVYGFDENECNEKAKTVSPEELVKPASRDNAWAPSTFKQQRTSSVTNESFHSTCSKESEMIQSSNSGNAFEKIEEGIENTKRGGKIPGYRRTASYIDYAADTFKSFAFVVFLFSFYVMASVYLVNMVGTNAGNVIPCKDPSSFGCILARTILNWLTYAVILSSGGLLIIIPVSVGNNQYAKTPFPSLFSMLVLALFASIPWLEVYAVEVLGMDVGKEWQTTRGTEYFKTILFCYTVAFALTELILVKNVVSVLVPKSLIHRFDLLRSLLLPSNVLRTAKQKHAATSKINLMIENAHKLHLNAHKKCKGGNASQATILNFVLHGEKIEPSGGFIWVWKSLFNQTLLVKEGVWIHARLAIGQAGQIMLGAVLGFIWWFGVTSAAKLAEAKRQEAIYLNDAATSTVLYIIPSKADIYNSLIPAGALTFTVLLLLVSVYFPNTTSTILKFRSGFLPSLHSPSFSKYRAQIDMVYYNIGNMIYAFVGSAVLLFLIFGAVLFLCFWKPTQEFMLYVIAWGIGITATLVIKILVLSCCRSRNIKAFFRIKPGVANISTLALECWHIGLASGTLIGRLTQFLLAMAFWIGRIDSVFLSEDVEVMGYRFDTVPIKFTTEILLHEAHRHPFIERMAAMYLMRLKYRDHFCSDAGAAWRRLFIATLFPWILKYREGYDDNTTDDQYEDFPVEEPENEEPPTSMFTTITTALEQETGKAIQMSGMPTLWKKSESRDPDDEDPDKVFHC